MSRMAQSRVDHVQVRSEFNRAIAEQDTVKHTSIVLDVKSTFFSSAFCFASASRCAFSSALRLSSASFFALASACLLASAACQNTAILDSCFPPCP